MQPVEKYGRLLRSYQNGELIMETEVGIRFNPNETPEGFQAHLLSIKPRRDEHLVLCEKNGIRCAKRPEVLTAMRKRRAIKRMTKKRLI